MNIDLSTPALLFPAISLLLLAYTNRFLTTAQLIRAISKQNHERSSREFKGQIANLKKRLELTKWMQFFGVVSILLCMVSMFFIFIGFASLGSHIFGVSLGFMCVSLLLSLWEVAISTRALNLELKRLESL